MDSAHRRRRRPKGVVQALVVQVELLQGGSAKPSLEVGNARNGVVAKEGVLDVGVVGQGVLAQDVAELAQVINGVLWALGSRRESGVPGGLVDVLRRKVALGHPGPAARLPRTVPNGLLGAGALGAAKLVAGSPRNQQRKDAPGEQP